MAASKNTRQLYSEHVNSFFKHLKRARRLNKKEVHKLRVKIKNLRVLFAFLNALPQEKFRFGAMSSLLKPVFKKAGNIRTAHLNHSLISRYSQPVMLRFGKQLEKEEEKAGKQLIKAIRGFDEKEFKKLHQKNIRAFRSVDLVTIHGTSKVYVENMFAKIRLNLPHLNDDEILHQLRKDLKTIKNIQLQLSDMAPVSAPRNELKKIDKTYEKIGHWHDGAILFTEFENYLQQNETGAVQRQALPLLLKLKAKNEKAKVQIVKELRKELV